MKLAHKFTLSFVAIVLLLTPVTMGISYFNIRKRLDNAEIERLKEVNDRIAGKLRNGVPYSEYTQGHPIAIDQIYTPLPLQTTQVTETQRYNHDLGHKECILTVTSYYSVAGGHYRIASYNYVTKSSEILKGMLGAVIWKVVLLVLGMIVTARVLSHYVLSPFRDTMETIKGFRLQQKEKLQLPQTSTTEFRELNGFLQKMTDKAIEDYASVKEFSENASHELQTPLAVIRSKIELLADTGIDATQAALIGDMQNAIEKLTRINRSLTFLTKLENHEFETAANVRFCRIANEVIASYEDWISLKQLRLDKQIDKQIFLNLHPSLAEMLLNNLLSNAIRHNIEGGHIGIELTAQHLCVRNTGLPPEGPTEELFQRFKKSNQCADSIGLGLAIVKQICEVNRFTVSYDYTGGWHVLFVHFDKSVYPRYRQPAAAEPAA